MVANLAQRKMRAAFSELAKNKHNNTNNNKTKTTNKLNRNKNISQHSKRVEMKFGNPLPRKKEKIK